MAVAPALVVDFIFNPPEVTITGPIQESTLAKLSEQLPHLASNSFDGRRHNATFAPVNGPLRTWKLFLPLLICEDVAKMRFMVAVLDAIENEGGWSMRDTQAISHVDQEEHMFFFTSRAR